MPLSLFHLHGDLKELRFPRLLAALREDSFTGVFQATTQQGAAGAQSDEITREVHFSSGHIAWAISTHPDESLRSYLLKHRAVTEAQWVEAEQRAKETTLRQSLIEMGVVGARELTQMEKGRAEEIVLAFFPVSEGEYRVRERQLAPGTPDLGIDPRPLILRGVMEGVEQALVMDEVGSLDTVFVVKRPALDEPGLALPGEFQSVLRHLDGKRSIAQICALTSLPDNFVCSLLAALSMIGAVRRNYERTHMRSRGEIVRGAEVAAAARAAPAAPASAGRPAEPPAARLPLEARAAPPRIATTPFAGEGPVTPLDATELEEEAEPPEEGPDPAHEREEPSAAVAAASSRLAARLSSLKAASGRPTAQDPEPEPDEPSPPRGPSSSALSLQPEEPARPDELAVPGGTSRPWFLLGGAAAVGVAALFLILMAQEPGGAQEAIVIAPQGASLGATPEPQETSTERQADNPAGAETTDTGSRLPVAPESGADMLGSEPQAPAPLPAPRTPASRQERGQERLSAGDYVSAARYFGREVVSRSGGYTIQLLTACQDETLRRAVDQSAGSPDLFILSTTLDGRSCYRVFWGRYQSRTRAQEALRRDVPGFFLQDRATPRVIQLGG